MSPGKASNETKDTAFRQTSIHDARLPKLAFRSLRKVHSGRKPHDRNNLPRSNSTQQSSLQETRWSDLQHNELRQRLAGTSIIRSLGRRKHVMRDRRVFQGIWGLHKNTTNNGNYWTSDVSLEAAAGVRYREIGTSPFEQ